MMRCVEKVSGEVVEAKVAGTTEVRGPSFRSCPTRRSRQLRGSSHSTLQQHAAAKMAPALAPPDEQEFDQPGIIGTFPVPDLHAGNNLFFYFTSSPWFEPQCNNISVWSNVRLNDPSTAEHIMNDRKLWQDRLDAIRLGTQYVLAGEGQGEGHPWLLQRQNKVEVTEKDGDEAKVETVVEGNYYTHGSKMLMAPSLRDILQSRLVRRDKSWMRGRRS
jgi:hypothetical protein